MVVEFVMRGGERGGDGEKGGEEDETRWSHFVARRDICWLTFEFIYEDLRQAM
jgi:hypothetical protein